MPRKMSPLHPGEVLREEFMKPLAISAYRLAKDIRVPANRIQMIVKEQRNVTADTALRLARYFGTTPGFWMNLQHDFDFETTLARHGKEIKAIQKLAS